MEIVEATPSAGPELAAFLLDNPMAAGVDFVLDRTPDFNALLGLRGRHRTFCAYEAGKLVGTATALWDERLDGTTTVRVGEFVDLRIASSSRGGRAARHLLAAVLEALSEVGVEWLCAVIGDENRAARTLVEGKAGFPRLEPLTRYVSVHVVPVRAPAISPRGVDVRSTTDADAAIIQEAVERTRRPLRLAPVHPIEWPDPNSRHRAWLAAGPGGDVIGGLVVWDGFDVRRVRVMRYTGADRALKLLTGALAQLRLAPALPTPGGPLRMWASRAVWNARGSSSVTRALVSTAIVAAARAGVHVLQLNFRDGNPIMDQLPPYPRSVFRSTLYGARVGRDTAADVPSSHGFFVDLAMV